MAFSSAVDLNRPFIESHLLVLDVNEQTEVRIPTDARICIISPMGGILVNTRASVVLSTTTQKSGVDPIFMNEPRDFLVDKSRYVYIMSLAASNVVTVEFYA